MVRDVDTSREETRVKRMSRHAWLVESDRWEATLKGRGGGKSDRK